MNKNKHNIIFALLIFSVAFSCESELEPDQDYKCGYGGETIMVIQEMKASVTKGECNCMLRFEEGIVTGAIYLNETIHSLLPCNLDEEFQKDGLEIIVSGEIKDNPAFSSHTNYTDFYITEIAKANT